MKSELEFIKEKDINADMKEMEDYMNRLQTSEFNYNLSKAVVISSVIFIAIAVGLGVTYLLWR